MNMKTVSTSFIQRFIMSWWRDEQRADPIALSNRPYPADPAVEPRSLPSRLNIFHLVII